MEELLLVEIKPVESYFWFIVFLCCICNFEQQKKKEHGNLHEIF